MIQEFHTKLEVLDYIQNFGKEKTQTILIRGSTANGKIKDFSDFDCEIYQEEKQNPHYEIILVNDKPILLTIYFYKQSKTQTPIKTPKNVKILKGIYTKELENTFQKEISNKNPYTEQQQITRKCQIEIDLFFKYLRHQNKEHLESINRKLKFKD